MIWPWTAAVSPSFRKTKQLAPATVSATPPPAEKALFAACAPGLEPFVLREMEGLGLVSGRGAPDPFDPTLSEASTSPDGGGVAFSGTVEDVYRANLGLRCANRVLVRMPAFRAAAFSELRRKAARLSWEGYLSKGQAVAFRVTCRKSRLYHGDAVAQRMALAVQDRLGAPVSTSKWKEEASKDGLQLVLVRLVHDICTVSIDSSGALLHRRGYRLATAKAPLRETLACALLYASGWDKTACLMDPFCGSGTIPIEAALWARRLPPGRFRDFAFENWPGFDSRKFKALLKSLETPEAATRPLILASDRDKGAVRLARENANRCGMAEFIRFSQVPVSAVSPPQDPGWVVTNPPFGIRIGRQGDLRNLYARLGRTLKEKCPAWGVTLLCADRNHVRYSGLSFDSGIRVRHGGRGVWIVRSRI